LNISGIVLNPITTTFSGFQNTNQTIQVSLDKLNGIDIQISNT
jgi:hypothetical protein